MAIITKSAGPSKIVKEERSYLLVNLRDVIGGMQVLLIGIWNTPKITFLL